MKIFRQQNHYENWMRSVSACLRLTKKENRFDSTEFFNHQLLLINFKSKWNARNFVGGPPTKATHIYTPPTMGRRWRDATTVINILIVRVVNQKFYTILFTCKLR